MRYLQRCYTKRMQYYLKGKMIEFESEKTIHCVRMTDVQHHVRRIHIFIILFYLKIGRHSLQNFKRIVTMYSMILLPLISIIIQHIIS